MIFALLFFITSTADLSTRIILGIVGTNRKSSEVDGTILPADLLKSSAVTGVSRKVETVLWSFNHPAAPEGLQQKASYPSIQNYCIKLYLYIMVTLEYS